MYLGEKHLSWWTLLNNIAVMWTNLELLLFSRGLIELPPLVCFPIWALVGTSILPLRLFSEKSSCLIYWICFSVFAYSLSGDGMLHKLCRVLFFFFFFFFPWRERWAADVRHSVLWCFETSPGCHAASSADLNVTRHFRFKSEIKISGPLITDLLKIGFFFFFFSQQVLQRE